MPISAEYGNSSTIFGGIDYQQALADGYDDDAINRWLKTTNTPTGPEMTSKFSNYVNKAVEKPSSDVSKKLSAEYGNSPTIFGGEDYKQALADGYDDDAINRWLKTTNTPTGPEMTSKFSNYGSKAVEKPLPDVTKAVEKPLPDVTKAFEKLLSDGSKKLSAEYGNSPTIFGGEDYKQALADGYNDDAINSWLKTTKTPTGPEMTSKFSNYGSKAVEKPLPDDNKAVEKPFSDDNKSIEKPLPDDYFDIDKFDKLLTRLEGSKGRQQRQKSTEGRRDIFAQGLASMMSNF